MSGELVKILQLENTISELKKELASVKQHNNEKGHILCLVLSAYPWLYGDSNLLKEIVPDAEIKFEDGWGHYIKAPITTILSGLKKNGYTKDQHLEHKANNNIWYQYIR
jgi:hypothetical protein